MRPYNDEYYTELLERLPRNLATGYEAANAITELLQTCARLNEYRENANTACGKWEARAKMLEQENKRLKQRAFFPVRFGEWVDANDLLPEQIQAVKKRSSMNMEVCSVIAYGTMCGSTERIVQQTNRILYHPTNNEFINKCILNDGYEFEKWYWARGWVEVTHWMPLPQLPKEEQDNG